MRRFLYTAFMLAISVMADAQSAYDAQNIIQGDLNGTARYIGMGGALGALGADLSTMSNNPAGTGLYRRSDASFTFGGQFTGNQGTMGHDRGRMSIDQAGVLFVLGGNGGDLRNINFGINYHKKRNFLSNWNKDLSLSGGSQTFQMAEMATDAFNNENFYDNQYFRNSYYGALVDYAAPLVDYSKSSNGDAYDGVFESTNVANFKEKYEEYIRIYNEENAKANPDMDRVKRAENAVPTFLYFGDPAHAANYRRATYGSNSQVDFNFSANLSDRFFAGISVGIYTMTYDREAAYSEETDYASYTLRNKYHSSADGVDVKFGFIFRPVEDSPFRIGLMAHTPTWYKTREYNSLSLDAETVYGTNPIGDYTSDEYEYNFRTPWKFGISLGHTVENYLAFGIEYEFQDLASAKYSYSRNVGYASDFDYTNNKIKSNLRGQHMLKVGVEAKPADAFAVRLGYNYISSPFKSDAYNHLDYNSSYTETDYTNWKDIHRITFGIGYRYKGGYIDLAYQYQMQNGDFYAYDYGGDYHLYSDTGSAGAPSPTKITNNRSQVVATLGFKF